MNNTIAMLTEQISNLEEVVQALDSKVKEIA
jgi:hypothetical protein